METLSSDDLLKSALAQVQQDIDSAFDAYLPVPDDSRARLVEAMRHATIGGGKRVRPLLVVAVADLSSIQDVDDIKYVGPISLDRLAAYAELNGYVPQGSDLLGTWDNVAFTVDEATAVLAGDALHALAFDILTQNDVSSDPFVRSELVSVLARASGHEGMAGGQVMDMAAEEQDYDLRQVTRLQQLKTGALLGASVEMGAILGRVPPEGRGHLRAYARDIGLAFQIADDLLDVEGDEALAGKALRKDGEQGKATFVTLMGAEKAREQARALVDQAVGHLSGHGSDARLLEALARFVVERDR